MGLKHSHGFCNYPVVLYALFSVLFASGFVLLVKAVVLFGVRTVLCAYPAVLLGAGIVLCALTAVLSCDGAVLRAETAAPSCNHSVPASSGIVPLPVSGVLQALFAGFIAAPTVGCNRFIVLNPITATKYHVTWKKYSRIFACYGNRKIQPVSFNS